MTTSTRWPNRRRTPRRGFTLAELLVALGVSTIVLGAVLGTTVFLARSSLRLADYSDMEREARAALEWFGRDTREASAITWNAADSVTLVVDSRAITYAYAGGTFRRTDAGGTRTLITGVTAFAFRGYAISGAELPAIGAVTSLANAGKWTKQLQLSLQTARGGKQAALATNRVLSARFILRNKRVTA